MQRIKIITPDPIVETLLTLLTERLPEPEENTLLLDTVWMERMEKFPEYGLFFLPHPLTLPI